MCNDYTVYTTDYIVYIAHFVTKEKYIFLDQHKLQIFPHKDFLIDFYTKVFSDRNILLSIQSIRLEIAIVYII